jgi:hypothetical protein
MRLNRKRLPEVFPSHIEKGWGFVELEEKYEALPMSPLHIMAIMGSPVAAGSGYDVHLDSLLSAAVLNLHPCSPKYTDNMVVSLPLKLLWLHDGWPLWAASDIIPENHIGAGREYWHKRYPESRIGFAKKRNANTSAGRYREYRVPMPVNHAEQMTAYAIGNRDEVQRLLDGYATHIGKKASYGYGRVLKWVVREVELPESEAVDTICRNRSIPAEYARSIGINGGLLPAAGWTPPYWYRPSFVACVDVRR